MDCAFVPSEKGPHLANRRQSAVAPAEVGDDLLERRAKVSGEVLVKCWENAMDRVIEQQQRVSRDQLDGRLNRLSR